jgi:hypothetical protein
MDGFGEQGVDLESLNGAMATMSHAIFEAKRLRKPSPPAASAII